LTRPAPLPRSAPAVNPDKAPTAARHTGAARGLFIWWQAGQSGRLRVAVYFPSSSSIGVDGSYNSSLSLAFYGRLRSPGDTPELSPTDPQRFVDKLLMDFHVGTLQRREIQ
jgi:hypothetical protein